MITSLTVLNPCERCGRKPIKVLDSRVAVVLRVECKCGNTAMAPYHLGVDPQFGHQIVEYERTAEEEWQKNTAHVAKLNAALDRIFAYAGMSADVLRAVIAETKAGVRG
jgi:hypothetical protein